MMYNATKCCFIIVLLGMFPLLATAALNAPEGDPQPGHLRMALVNMKSVYTSGYTTENDEARTTRNLEANIERHLYFIDMAADKGAQFIGFPEISVQGYDFGRLTQWMRKDDPRLDPIREAAARRGVYVAIGLAEIDENDHRRNTQMIIGPDGKTFGRYHKIWATEPGARPGTEYPVFEIHGARIGILICSDATDFTHLKALVDNGATILYAPMANSTGSTTSAWYHFRRHWVGTWDGTYGPVMQERFRIDTIMPSGGWVDYLNVYGAIHNHATYYHPDWNPPFDDAANPVGGFASGARFIGPDGEILAQMPVSINRADSVEYVLIYDIPLSPAQP